MDRTDTEALAESLRRLLAAIEAGQLAASGATRHRLEGAIAALEAIVGEPSTLMARLGVARA